MKHGTKILFLFVIIGMSVFFACNKETDYSDIPYISLISPNAPDALSDSATTFNVKLYFQDGDGNLGYYSWDTLAPYVGEYKSNLHFRILDKDSAGNYANLSVPEWNVDSVEFPFIIKYKDLTPVSKNGSIKGELEVQLAEMQTCRTYSKMGYVKFKIYMYDRDLNQSNIIYTDEIKVR